MALGLCFGACVQEQKDFKSVDAKGKGVSGASSRSKIVCDFVERVWTLDFEGFLGGSSLSGLKNWS